MGKIEGRKLAVRAASPGTATLRSLFTSLIHLVSRVVGVECNQPARDLVELG